MNLSESISAIRNSLASLTPEIILTVGILCILVAGFFTRQKNVFVVLSILFLLASGVVLLFSTGPAVMLFGNMLKHDMFSGYLRILMDLAGIFTCVISIGQRKLNKYTSEYFTLMLSIVLGGHLLVMANHFIMVFLSLEVISIGSYVFAGYGFDRSASEGSFKYFVFGSVASAVMLYGLTILYGMTGTLDFSSQEFFSGLIVNNIPLTLVVGMMVLAGFFFKISAAPMHAWTPDVYEAAPVPVIAFLSAVPKLAGLGIITKFVLAMHAMGESRYDWQLLISVVAILTLTVGNLSALWQKNPRRMMAYSSIAHSGFLLVGIAAFIPEGIYVMMFYAGIYVLMNFAVFQLLDYFEGLGMQTIEGFRGSGKQYPWAAVLLAVGLVALTGLPPTAGFTAKLFIFSALWESYELNGKPVLLALLIFGLLNTVISLFYYLRIPYFAFMKNGENEQKPNNLTIENLFGLILVLLLFVLFFAPGLLMGWINKINFAF